MADNEIKPSTDGGREELVAKQLASTKIHLALTQERADVSGAIKLPLERVHRHVRLLAGRYFLDRPAIEKFTNDVIANRQVWQSA